MFSISIKCILLIRTLFTLLNCVFLLAHAHYTILPILREDSNKMERWEPSEILAIPVPLDPLKSVTLHASASVSILSLLFFALEYFFLNKEIDRSVSDSYIAVEDPHHQSNRGQATPKASIPPWNFSDRNGRSSFYHFMLLVINYFIGSTLMQFIIFLIVILSGASPVENVHHTLLASAYLSNLMFSYIPPSHEKLTLFHSIANVVMAFSPFNKIESGKKQHQSPFIMMQERVTEFNAFILYSIIGILCPFMILNILDHGEQHQRWPLPIILAALLGHVIGVILGLVYAWARMYRSGTLSFKLHNV